jgi:hypothetical protein
MLHHDERRLFFYLMHMFGIHEFEFVACLNLNPKEKTKGKGIRKFRIKEKAKKPIRPLPWPFGPLAQPTSPRARVRSPPGGPHIGAAPRRPRALALSPFLSARWGAPHQCRFARSLVRPHSDSRATFVSLVPLLATVVPAPMACAPRSQTMPKPHDSHMHVARVPR